MTLWLMRSETGAFRTPPVDCDRYPCSTIMAGGLGGGNTSQYWLEDDGKARPMPKADKPPYRVPSMAEIRAMPWNGYTVVSTFAGTGGSSTGYRMAGFQVLWASEFIDAARDSYNANKAPYTVLDGRDIRTVQPDDILSATGLKAGELDVLDGSPPCASFSTAGKREAGWGKQKTYSDKSQRTDDLFFEFSRLVRGLQPKVFVAENVSGLIKGTAKGYFLDILRELKGCGYRVEARVLDAQWLGVPQARQRLIFVGVREDLGVAPAFPSPLSYRYTVRDALPHIRQVKRGGVPDNWQTSDRPSSCIVASGGTVSPTAYLSGGTYVEADAPEPAARMIVGNDGFEPVWGSLDQPSPTIMASGARTSGMIEGVPAEPAFAHPTERRKFSIAELRRICGFPDDFILTGSYQQQWERCGRAVPPVMMASIAAAIRDKVLDKTRPGAMAGPRMVGDAPPGYAAADAPTASTKL